MVILFISHILIQNRNRVKRGLLWDVRLVVVDDDGGGCGVPLGSVAEARTVFGIVSVVDMVIDFYTYSVCSCCNYLPIDIRTQVFQVEQVRCR